MNLSVWDYLFIWTMIAIAVGCILWGLWIGFGWHHLTIVVINTK